MKSYVIDRTSVISYNLIPQGEAAMKKTFLNSMSWNLETMASIRYDVFVNRHVITQCHESFIIVIEAIAGQLNATGGLERYIQK